MSMFCKKCHLLGSNQGPSDLQSDALPTELKRLASSQASLAQSVERKALNLVVVGSSPTVGDALAITLCT